MLALSVASILGLASYVSAHGGSGHEQIVVAPDADWATRHMAEEHHIEFFDSGSFFNLHDYDSSNEWTREDLLKTYGLQDESTNHIPPNQKNEAVQKVLDIFDKDRSGSISFAEYTIGTAAGLKLPDFGYGPGHHGDDEYEYEIHHFERFHDENTREEDLTHPEDIEHFRKHEMLEQQQERLEQMEKLSVVEANIPQKFRRNG